MDDAYFNKLRFQMGKITAVTFFPKIISNHIWPFLCVSTFLGAFYYFTSPMLWLEVQNPREASLLWTDVIFVADSQCKINNNAEYIVYYDQTYRNQVHLDQCIKNLKSSKLWKKVNKYQSIGVYEVRS